MQNLWPGEYALHLFINSSFFRTKLNWILTNLISIVVQIHLVAGCNFYASTGKFLVDFAVQICVSIAFSLYSFQIIHDNVARWTPQIAAFSQFLVENWSIENYKFWKKCVLLGISGYACIILCVATINNHLLFLLIVQNATTFLILEQIEQGSQGFVQKWWREWRHGPQVKKRIVGSGAAVITPNLIESYVSAPVAVRRRPFLQIPVAQIVDPLAKKNN